LSLLEQRRRTRSPEGKKPRCSNAWFQALLQRSAVRYPAIYANAAEAFGRNSSLTAVQTRSSPLSGTRKIAEVIFAYTNRNTDVTEKFFVRVDVTEEFPFLVTKMSPYYDR
jgi:PatG C-terminal